MSRSAVAAIIFVMIGALIYGAFLLAVRFG
jgi:hypothetical protein